MKKFISFVFIIIIFSISSFIGGYWYFMKTNIATISIKNSSTKQIMAVRVVYDRGEIVASGLKKKKEKKIRFYTKVNGTYRVLVTFENDKNIESERRQFEPGDICREIVSDSTILANAS